MNSTPFQLNADYIELCNLLKLAGIADSGAPWPIAAAFVVGLPLALGGIALTVGPAGGQIYGIVLAISAAAIYSVYIIVGARVMRDVTAVQSSAVIFASAGAMSGLIMALHGAQWPASSAGWAAIFGIVVLATLFPVVAFLAGLEHIGPTNAAMLSTLEPVVTVLLAVVLLGEVLQPVTLLLSLIHI